MKIIPVTEDLYNELLQYLESQKHPLAAKVRKAGESEVVEISDTDRYDHVYAIQNKPE